MNDHPNKDIRAAVDCALAHGWRLIKAGPRAHCWGRLLCAYGQRGGCQMSVYSTPKNPRDHAQRIRRAVDQCPH